MKRLRSPRWRTRKCQGKAETRAALHVDEGQRDGYAEPAAQDVVQHAVAWIVVVGHVAREADLVEEVVVEYVDLGERLVGQRNAVTDGSGQRIQQRKLFVDVHVRLGVCGNEQGAEGKVNLLIRQVR